MNNDDNTLNTIKYVYDDLKKIIKSCVIKYDNIARSYETAESKREFDYYLIASRGIDTFDSYPSFSEFVLKNAGILDIKKIHDCEIDKNNIPKNLRQRVLEENRKYIISTYTEKNNYYRTLIGLPDNEDTDFVYLDKETCDRYRLDPTMPIHMMDDHEVNSLGFHLDDIIAAHPDKEYLKYLGSRKVDLIRARTAKNFDIIKADLTSHVVFLKMFFSTYELCREYFASVIYVREKHNQDELYDKFIAMSIMIMTIQRIMVDTFKLGVNRDFYDLDSIRVFFDSYGIPFFEALPLDYQRLIMKRINILLRSKSTDRCLYDITNILFFDRVTIFEYYLMKEQKYDDNNIPLDIKKPIEDIDGSVRYIEDIDKMYDLYFQAVDMKEKNVSLALENKSNSYDYYEVTYEDPHWWDDEDLRMKLTESEFNYIDTKYIGVNIMYNLTKMMFETVYFINMLVDKKNDIHRPNLNFYLTIKLPRITVEPVSIFDAVILLCALTCKKNHFKGNIIKTGTKILSVMGFDFKENFNLIRKNIKKDKKIYDQEILKYLQKMNIYSKEDINTLYNNMVGLADFCVKKMNSTDDIKVYHAYKYLYDSLMVKDYTTKVLTKSNGEVADTYLDYLNDQNPFLADFVNACSIEQTGIYIDHILGTLNEIIPDLEYLSTINGTDNILVEVLVKLIEFFKSYTVDLRNLNILYVMDSRRYNMIKMISDCTITATIRSDDNLKYYLDMIEVLGVENFFNDYVIPIEMIYMYNKLTYKDQINNDEKFTIAVEILYRDMMKVIYADSLRLSDNMNYDFKIILDHMQEFIATFFINEKIKSDEDYTISATIYNAEYMKADYFDSLEMIFSEFAIKNNLEITDDIRYNFNIIYKEIMKCIEEWNLHGRIEEKEFIDMRLDAIRLFIENTEFKDRSLHFEDLYKIINDTIFGDTISKKELYKINEIFDIDDKMISKYSDHEALSSIISEKDIVKISENIRIYYE